MSVGSGPSKCFEDVIGQVEVGSDIRIVSAVVDYVIDAVIISPNVRNWSGTVLVMSGLLVYRSIMCGLLVIRL